MSDVAVRAALSRPVASPVIGGHLALDFCNTAGEHLAAKPGEMLLDWELFVRWAVPIGLIGADGYAELLQARAPMGKVVQVREAIYRGGLAIARGERLPQDDLL